jgi:hypothetical protein
MKTPDQSVGSDPAPFLARVGARGFQFTPSASRGHLGAWFAVVGEPSASFLPLPRGRSNSAHSLRSAATRQRVSAGPSRATTRLSLDSTNANPNQQIHVSRCNAVRGNAVKYAKSNVTD